MEVSDKNGSGNAGRTRRQLAGVAIGALLAGVASREAQAQVAATDTAALNLALNMSYLCGQYYCFAMFGRSLGTDEINGFGFGGAQPGRTTGGGQVNWGDRTVQLAMDEVGFDTFSNIRGLRNILRGDLVAQPDLDVSPAPFTIFMRNAGAIGAGDTFNPYASTDNFLLGALLINDVMVTMYRGMIPTVVNPLVLASISGLLTTKAAHAAAIRQMIYRRSPANQALIFQADRISDQRDRLDGGSDLDQGLSPEVVAGQVVTNITACDANGEAFSRTPQQVLNIVYGTSSAVSRGGFFPAGVAGSITTSAAN
ncbi:hypothetical protein FHT00_003597 [Sphingomonas insulae]|uniref:Ferritin-like domain-containing protein n=1 Tax=Sphingomonas insulae TaxID=424800 RepID=A0ABP3T521_9SPHN|nr:hypothetical protein [Sphingomonas insulae]